MSINTFDVDPTRVRDDFFPRLIAGFTPNSPPTRETVERWCTEEAGELAGKLLQKSITAEAITDDETPAWVWCSRTVALMVAIRCLPVMTNVNSEVGKLWAEQLKARLDDLDARGELALGIAPTSTAQPDGPMTYINNLDLDDPDPADASTLTPVIRRSDML